MALIKSEKEIKELEEGGAILAYVLQTVAAHAASGVSTMQLERIALDEIQKKGATPAFKGYKPHAHTTPFPAALCTSVNDEVVHCTPRDERVLQEGDLLTIDLGIKHKDLYTDAAITVPIGVISKDAQRLLDGTKEALAAGIKQVISGKRIGDISHAIEEVGKKYQLGVIRDLVGHGVGHDIHEAPSVPNYGKKGSGEKLQEGMVLAIEPMFTLGHWAVEFRDDGWTVATQDGSLAAHFEHTVAVTKDGALILTK